MSTVFALGNSNSWSVRGYVNPILSHFCLFSEILCLFLQFSALESCYIWHVIFVHMFTVGALGKFKIWVHQGGTETLFEPVLPIFLDFLSFSSFFHIGILLYLVYTLFRVS